MYQEQPYIITHEEQRPDHLLHSLLALLKELISKPSFSGQELFTATLIQCFLQNHWVKTHRKLHNVWAFNYCYDPAKPTILLSTHHDTVVPDLNYTRDPFDALLAGDKLYGLGSNASGGALVAMLAAFLHFYNREDMAFNLCYAATAEKETSGENGLKLILPQLGHLDFAIVAEPTLMNLAIAERGLMVLDCEATPGTRQTGESAVYKTLTDIQWFSNFVFPKISTRLGAVKMTVTSTTPRMHHQMTANSCGFSVDIKLTDAYTQNEILQIIKKHVKCTVKPRHPYLKPTVIDTSHPVVQAGMLAGCNTYSSQTTSDQAFLNIPSVKLGPGNPARSRMLNEFIHISEIQHGINIYIKMLEMLIFTL